MSIQPCSKKAVYLANPYSPLNKEAADAELTNHRRRLMEAWVGGMLIKLYGVNPILPIALSAAMSELHHFDTGFQQWVDNDYDLIRRCDEVWVLMTHGWKESVGVTAEIKYAKELGMPVKYIDPLRLTITDTP